MFKAWIPAFAGMTMFWSSASVLVHAGVGGGLYYMLVVRQPAPIVAELDLSMSPLVALPANKGGGKAKAIETWTASKQKTAAAPVAQKIETKEEVLKEESQVTPCEGPACGEPTG